MSPREIHTRDEKVSLLEAAFRHINNGLWEAGDADRFGWMADELKQIEREFETVSFEELRQRLRYLYKRIAIAKVLRHRRGNDSGRAAALNPSAAGDEVPRDKESQMSIFLTVKDVKSVPEGQHNAVIRAI